MRARLVALAALAVVSLPAGCGGGQAPPAPHGTLRMATGNVGGVYAAYGEGVARLAEERFPDLTVTTVPTGGSVENLRLVASGRADVGFALADVAADAVAGRPPVDDPLPVVALAHLYDNYVQLVVRADSPVREVADLRGHRVSVGAPGSGTAVVAERILGVGDLVPGRDLPIERLDIGASAEALVAGRIDAFFWSGGLPTQAIEELRDAAAVRLVDLSNVVDELVQEYGEHYTETTVPATVYGPASSVTTVSVPNYLVVARDMPEERAYWLTRLLFDGQAELVKAHPEARRLDLRAAIATYPLDLHPGAVHWFREAHR